MYDVSDQLEPVSSARKSVVFRPSILPSHMSDGRAVGVPMGACVGGAVAVMLGLHDGAADGSVVLSPLGASVGDADGASVNAVGAE